MMSNKSGSGSLLGREATGGEIAGKGFDFQASMLLCDLPHWLAQSGFSEVIREALGDTEVKFFVPGKGDCYEFFEYKDHRLTPSEFWPEIDRFFEMETVHPKVYRRYKIVCPDVNDDLKPLCNELDRLRRALPFYNGVTSVQDNSFQEFAERVKCHRSENEFVRFVFEKVDIIFKAPIESDAAIGMFQQRLVSAIPECQELNNAQIERVRVSLKGLVASRVAIPINRSDIVTDFQNVLPGFDLPTLNCIRLFTANTPQQTWDCRPELVYKWQQFSGQDMRLFPDKEIWEAGMEELLQTRDWIVSSKAPRLIRLEGMRRLSVSVALGFAFSATAGFVVEVENRGNFFRTDEHSGADTPPYNWQSKEDVKRADEIAVAISVKRGIETDVRAYLAGSSSVPLALLMHGTEAMVSAEQMNLAVEQVKERISSIIVKSGACVVHLFIAVPGPWALFLGHRLNAICTVQCYEHTGGSNYVPSFRIDCV